jgi:spermidine synthase
MVPVLHCGSSERERLRAGRSEQTYPDAVTEQPHFEFRTDDRGGVTVLRDGHPQSHVDLRDPELLVFEYVAQLAIGIDLLPAGPAGITHIGGAGLTLARYVQHTRPGSPQIVLEPDTALTEAVRRELPLPRNHRIRVRPQDGASGVAALRDDSADALVLDAYDEGRVPADLLSPTAIQHFARVLRPKGIALLNLADEPNRRHLARELATVAEAFPHAVVLALADVMKGRRFGNYVVLASTAPFDTDEIRRRATRLAATTTVRAATTLRGTAKAFTDDDGAPSPPPPELGAWRAR